MLGDTAIEARSVAEAGSVSPVAAVCRPPRLAGRQRTTGGLSDSNDSDSVSRAAEEQVLHCYSGLRVNFAKFSFQKYSQRPAVTRRGPSLSGLPSLAAARVTQACAARVTRRGPIHSPRPRPAVTRSASFARPVPSHSPRPTVTRSCLPFITLRAAGRPASLVAARATHRGPLSLAATCRRHGHSSRAVSARHGSHSPRPAITLRSPPKS